MKRISSLDGLRAFAFLSVFFHHALQIPILWVGVDLFFVLSGFLITSILIRERDKEPKAYFGSFYKRRFRRIIPPYFIFLVVAGLLYKFDWMKIWYWYVFFGANIAESFGLGGGGVLQPMWSLAVEEQFYLFWPLLVYYVRARRLQVILWSLLILAPLARCIGTSFFKTHFPIYFLTPFRIDLLAAGALIACFCDDRAWPARNKRFFFRLMVASLAVFAALTVASPNFRTSANSYLFNTLGYSLIVLIFASLVVCCLALEDNWIRGVLTNRVLVYLGRISYTMYLIHEVMIGLFKGYGPVITAVGGLAATICCASLSWHLLERRLTQHKPEIAIPAALVTAS